MKPVPTAFDLRVTFEQATLPSFSDGPFVVSGSVASGSSKDWTSTTFKNGPFLRPAGATDVKLLGLSCPGCTASLDANVFGVNGKRAFSIPFSMDGMPKTIALKRLDVDDVEVTPAEAPGNPYTVKGTWSLTGPGGIAVAAVPTGYGIDLPSGHYTLVIKYETREKPAQTQSFELDL
ncbi:MAG TPA: hypothetical protein VLR88_00905 [Propionibacteriaceae bacterium]|nr:hypothetical protein [Propionibacteriaceae bacterium]